jgi:hypothetical protein
MRVYKKGRKSLRPFKYLPAKIYHCAAAVTVKIPLATAYVAVGVVKPAVAFVEVSV